MEQQYPETLEQRIADLKQSRADLLAEAANCEDISLPASLSDRWSVAEILYHLHIVETMILTRLKTIGNPTQPRKSDEELHEEWLKLIKFVPNREARINAPAPAQPPKSPKLSEARGLLDQSRAQLLAVIADKTFDQLASFSMPHPVETLGQLSGVGWLTLIAYHELRHADQIKELKAALAQAQ